MQLDPALKEFTKKLLIVLALAGSLFLLYQLRYIVILLFFIVVISYTLLPFVEYFEKYKIPRGITTAFVLLITLGIFGGIGFLIYTAVREEFTDLAQLISNNYNTVSFQFNLDDYISDSTLSPQELISQIGSTILSSFQTGFQGAVGVGSTIFSILFSLITSVTLLFYLVYEPAAITNTIINVLPIKYQSKTKELVHKIQLKLSKWLQGQLLLMVIMAAFSYFGYLLIGVPYALILSLLVGILDIVPVIGPTIALIPIILVTALDSPVKIIFVIIYFLFLQNIEANVLVPRVMSKTVGLNPLYVIIALLIGSGLGGTLGGLLAIPGSVIIKILYEEWLAYAHKQQNSKSKKNEIKTT